MGKIVDFLLFDSADNLSSIFIRMGIWLLVVLFFAFSVQRGKDYSRVKADAGWFFVFLFGISVASYFVFGATIKF
jgi:hypothetical protein